MQKILARLPDTAAVDQLESSQGGKNYCSSTRSSVPGLLCMAGGGLGHESGP